MKLLNDRFGYSKLDKEDPDEVKHRRAQFLIYKAMKQADSPRRRPSWLKVRATKLEIGFGKRLKKLRNSILSFLSEVQIGFQKQIISQFRAFKRFIVFRSRKTAINSY